MTKLIHLSIKLLHFKKNCKVLKNGLKPLLTMDYSGFCQLFVNISVTPCFQGFCYYLIDKMHFLTFLLVFFFRNEYNSKKCYQIYQYLTEPSENRLFIFLQIYQFFLIRIGLIWITGWFYCIIIYLDKQVLLLHNRSIQGNKPWKQKTKRGKKWQ